MIARLASLIAIALAAACAHQLSPIARGRYVFGGEVRSFQPCGDANEYWVVTSDSNRMRLRTLHGQLTSRPYQAIYIEVRGARTDGVAGEFSRAYDGLFRIDTILKVSAAIPGSCSAPAKPKEDAQRTINTTHRETVREFLWRASPS